MSTAHETVDKILTDASVRFVATGGARIKLDTWDCYLWDVSLQKMPQGAGFRTPYHCGVAHVEQRKKAQCDPYSWQYREPKPKAPSAADVLYCLLSDGRACDQSFDDWCSELGESNDSIKALATYQACCKTGKQLRSVFTSTELAALEVALQDF